MKKLFLNNAVIKDIKLSDYEIAVYVALRSLYDSQKELQYVTYNSVVFELYAPFGDDTRTSDYKAGYIESNNFTPKDDESHGENDHGIFCVTGNDVDLVDIDDLFEDW